MRRQAAEGRLLTNHRHQVVKLDDPLACLLVAHLDGRRTLADLAGLVEGEARAGRLELKLGDQILVKCLALEGNKIKLSRKAVLREQRDRKKVGTAAE